MGTATRAGVGSSPRRSLAYTNRTAREKHRKPDRSRLIALIVATVWLFDSAGKSKKIARLPTEYSPVPRSARKRNRHHYTSRQGRQRDGHSRRFRMRRSDGKDSVEVQWDRIQGRRRRPGKCRRAVEAHSSRSRHRGWGTIRVLDGSGGRERRENALRLQ